LIDIIHPVLNLIIYKNKLISKTRAIRLFLLNDEDLNKLNAIQIYNSNQKYYKYEQIEKIVINKYGNFDNLNNLLNKKKIKQEIKNNNKLQLINNRKEYLKNLFELNKLEFKTYGNCYSYINYGKPDPKIIIENEIKKNKEIIKRKIELIVELYKNNIEYNENIKICYDYIYNYTNLELKEIINELKEYNIINKTKNKIIFD